MHKLRWIKSFAMVLGVAFAAIVLGQLLQDRSVSHALSQGALWAPLSAAIFSGTSWYKRRKGRSCAACSADADPRP